MSILEQFNNAVTKFNRENNIRPVFGRIPAAKICRLGKLEMEQFKRMAPVFLQEDSNVREMSFVDYISERYNVQLIESDEESEISVEGVE